MNIDVVEQAHFLQQTMKKVIPMLDHEAEEPYLSRFLEVRGTHYRYTFQNRKNRELRDLLKQIRRDSIRLEKMIMQSER